MDGLLEFFTWHSSNSHVNQFQLAPRRPGWDINDDGHSVETTCNVPWSPQSRLTYWTRLLNQTKTVVQIHEFLVSLGVKNRKRHVLDSRESESLAVESRVEDKEGDEQHMITAAHEELHQLRKRKGNALASKDILGNHRKPRHIVAHTPQRFSASVSLWETQDSHLARSRFVLLAPSRTGQTSPKKVRVLDCICTRGQLWHDVPWEKHNLEPVWERMMRRVDLKKLTTFLAQVYLDALDANANRTNNFVD